MGCFSEWEAGAAEAKFKKMAQFNVHCRGTACACGAMPLRAELPVCTRDNQQCVSAIGWGLQTSKVRENSG